MNFQSWPHEFDPRDLDRLVDAQLGPTELKELIETLDSVPEGWKTCALAFLEAQALQQELSADDFWDEPLGETTPELDERPQGSPAHARPAENAECDDELLDPTLLDPTLLDPKWPLSSFEPTNGRINGESSFPFTRPESDQVYEVKSQSGTLSIQRNGKPHEAAQVSPRFAKRDSRSQLNPTSWRMSLAVAASIAGAFALGIVGRTVIFSGKPDQVDSLTDNGRQIAVPPTTPDEEDQRTTFANRSEPIGEVTVDFASLQDEGEQEVTSGQPASVIVFDESSAPTPESIDLPEEIQELIESNRAQVFAQRTVRRVKSESGDVVLVPIETYEIVPRSSRDRYH